MKLKFGLHWKVKLLLTEIEKLHVVGIRAKQITSMNEDCGDWKVFVQIEPSGREKMTEVMFPLRVSGLKMESLATG